MFRRLVAVAQKPLVLLITANNQPFCIVRQMGGCIGRNIVGNQNLIADVIGKFLDGPEAGIGIAHLIVNRDHNGHLGGFGMGKMKFAMLKVNIPDLKIPVP